MWKEVKDYEGIYEVSDNGEIRSLGRFVTNNGTEVWIEGTMKTTRQTKQGYVLVDLWKDGKGKTYKVHRLVAEAYIPNPEGKETVNHIDGNKANNNVSNLEWATQKEQNLHFYQHNLKSKENVNKAIQSMNRANSKKVRCIETNVEYPSANDAGRTLGKSDGSAIVACCRGKRKVAYGFTWEYC